LSHASADLWVIQVSPSSSVVVGNKGEEEERKRKKKKKRKRKEERKTKKNENENDKKMKKKKTTEKRFENHVGLESISIVKLQANVSLVSPQEKTVGGVGLAFYFSHTGKQQQRQ